MKNVKIYVNNKPLTQKKIDINQKINILRELCKAKIK